MSDQELRTQEEIAIRFKERQAEEDTLFDFYPEVLLEHMDFGHAKSHLKDGVTESEWTDARGEVSYESVKDEMEKYLEFAWSKALDHRGLSAMRSIQKLSAYCWLLGNDECVEYLAGPRYAPYGGPMLKFVSDTFGFLFPESEEALRLAQGLSCIPLCDEGCNS